MNIVSWKDITSTFSQSVAQLLRVKSTCDMSLLEGFFHFTDFIFKITKMLDHTSKELAGETLLNTPVENQKNTQAFIQTITYVLSTGDNNSEKEAIADYTVLTMKTNDSTIEEVFSRCRKLEAQNQFCKKLKTENPVAFQETSPQSFAKKMGVEHSMANRIRIANGIAKSWKDKSSRK